MVDIVRFDGRGVGQAMVLENDGRAAAATTATTATVAAVAAVAAAAAADDVLSTSPQATAATGTQQSQQLLSSSFEGAGGHVQICINDVSVDEAGDESAPTSGDVDKDDTDDDETLRVESSIRRGQRRRRSWAPENERNREEKEETQKKLGVAGRSQSLSSLEGREDEDREDTGNNNEEMEMGEPLPNRTVSPSSSIHSLVTAESLIFPDDQEHLDSEHTVKSSNRAPNDNGNGLLQSLAGCSVDEEHSTLSEPSMLEQLDNALKKFKGKEEKQSRRDSVFSKISSYRQKWINEKNCKSFKNTHAFVPVSFSNSTSCDICSKPLSNKAALQCQNCTVNVHENSCRDQTMNCPRLNNKNILTCSQSMKDRKTSTTSPTGSPSSLRGTQSMRESTTSGPQLFQVKNADETPVTFYIQPTTTSVSLSSSGTDDGHASEDVVDGLLPSLPPLESLDWMFSKAPPSLPPLESLDWMFSKVSDLADDDDADLLPKEKEPEAWSVTVDMKTVNRMNSKDIKRQDHIWEFIQTEKNHYRTLKIMQKIFARCMVTHVGLSQTTVDQMFPSLDNLIDIHRVFLTSFLHCRSIRPDFSIEEMGDLLVKQFDGHMGVRMKKAYGDFCSRHLEAVNIYKELLKTDRKFLTFINKCSRNPLCNRLVIPECILLVTQRVTKYPLLIDPIIKTTKETNVRELKQLSRSLALIQDILKCINRHIESREKEKRLADIYRRFDPKSCARFKGEKFQKIDLMLNHRKLRHESMIKWMSANGKPAEVLAVILSDVMVFLSENNQKFAFFSQDHKSSIISLSKLLVRENGDTRDSKGVFLICPSKTEPEMYKLVCRSSDERRQWIATLRDAISKSSREELTGRLDIEEDSLYHEVQATELDHYIDDLREKDRLIRTACDEKIRIIVEILNVTSGKDKPSWRSQSDDDSPDAIPLTSLLQLVTQTETELLESLYLSTTTARTKSPECITTTTKPIRKLESQNSSSQPKRAETFSGFDKKAKSNELVRQQLSAGHTRCDEVQEKKSFDIDPETNENNERNSVGLSLPACSNRGHRRASFSVLSTAGVDAEISEDIKGRRMSANLEPSLLEALRATHSASVSAAETGISGIFESSTLELNETVDKQPLSSNQTELFSLLLQRVHMLSECALQKSTETESLRAKLAEARNLTIKLSAENDRLLCERRPGGYLLDKQLEELRLQETVIQQEKTELVRIKEQHEYELRQQHEAVLLSRNMLNEEKAKIEVQKEELQRQRDALQRQIDLFHEQKRNCKTTTSSGKIQSTCADRTVVVSKPESEARSRAQSGTALVQNRPSEQLYRSTDLSNVKPPLTGRSISASTEGTELLRTGSAGSLTVLESPWNATTTALPKRSNTAAVKPGEASGSDVGIQMIPVKLSTATSARPVGQPSATSELRNTLKDASTSKGEAASDPTSIHGSRSNASAKSLCNILPMKLTEGGAACSSSKTLISNGSADLSNSPQLTIAPPFAAETLPPTESLIAPVSSRDHVTHTAGSPPVNAGSTGTKKTTRVTEIVYV